MNYINFKSINYPYSDSLNFMKLFCIIFYTLSKIMYIIYYDI